MSIGREQVEKVAKLAAIAVDDAELEPLVAQLSRIVDYVEQLNEVSTPEGTEGFHPGPETLPLREDVVRRFVPGNPLDAMAPEFEGGLFLVPVRGTMAEE